MTLSFHCENPHRTVPLTLPNQETFGKAAILRQFPDCVAADRIRPGSAVLGPLVITFGQRESPPAAAPLQCYYH
jgi:hypothetical protein